jgi:hypothetical protein
MLGPLPLLPGRAKHAGVSRPVVRAPVRPSERWLYRRGASQLAALADALQRAGVNRGIRRAADAYDAGQLLNESRQDRLDLVAAIVLARDGLQALRDETPTPSPPCFVNPLHGPCRDVIGRYNFRLHQPPSHNRVPACETCARRRFVDERVLCVPDGGGRFLPYFLIVGFWTRTGFGAFEPDFPRRVLAHLGVD